MSSAQSKTEPADAHPFRSVGIVGLGVMGGSFAMALHRCGWTGDVVGWSVDDADLDAAERSGAISRRAGVLEEAFDGVDLIVLAVPLQVTCELLGRLAPVAASHVIVHDVASLKVPVGAAVAEHGLQSQWVGGHPMCGSEASGFQAARPELYDDARVWIVADETSEAGARRVESLWRELGAHPQRTDAMSHDALMAMASHLPQLTANVLAQILSDAGMSVSDLGPGGRDATRLAESSPEMWLDILAHAPVALPEALRRLGTEATRLADAVEQGDLDPVRDLLEQSRAWRQDS